jgi:hypothetical protein
VNEEGSPNPRGWGSSQGLGVAIQRISRYACKQNVWRYIMPCSYGFFKSEIKSHILNNIDVESEILDVGAGCGTYAKLLHPEYRNIDAIEIFEQYITQYNLNNLYRNIYVGDILNFNFDLYNYLIFGDVLEHMSIPDAQYVLNRINQNNQKCLIAVPYLFEQGESEGNVYETHLQPDLTHEVFMNRYANMKTIYRNEHYGYYCNYNFTPCWKKQIVQILQQKIT